MPALFFPNLDTLRLALVSGLVPPAVARGPARAGFDAHGRLWLEPDDALSREALTALGRIGVLALGGPGVPTHAVRCWAELLPLRRTGSKPDGPVLFDQTRKSSARWCCASRRFPSQGFSRKCSRAANAFLSWSVQGASKAIFSAPFIYALPMP